MLLSLSAQAPAAEPDAEPSRPGSGRRVLATGAALVPGVIVHGSGHYVLGETETGNKLLLAEGIGAGMVLGGGLGLFLTGASRHTVLPLASLTIFGAGVFTSAFLADIYGSAASDLDEPWSHEWSAPARFESELGYRYVNSAVFAYSDFVFQRFELWLGRTRIEPSLWSSFEGDNARYRLLLSGRLLGAYPGFRHKLLDFVEAELGLTHHRYAADFFERTTLEGSLRGRWDLRHVGPSLRGAFVEGSLGYARNVTSFDFPGVNVESDYDDLLLATMAFGIRLRGPAAIGSEVMFFYDHRHDDFAAGMLMEGLGGGVGGHLGMRGRWFFDERFGVAAESMFGSAIVAGASILVREGSP